MSDERTRVEHPSWCDLEACTAGEFRPTSEEYQATDKLGEHRSRMLVADKYRPGGGVLVYLSQLVAPWVCATYLVFQIGEGEYPDRITTEVGGSGLGFDLFELLAEDIGAQTLRYPTLYEKRFGYVADAMSDRATADASVPSDPVELQERMAAEEGADEVDTFMATCTPNSQPEGGRAEHGYQINVIDVMAEDLTILATIDLPEWESFRPASAGHRLIEHGYMIRPDARGPEKVNGWTKAPNTLDSWSVPVIRVDVGDTTGSADEGSETPDVGAEREAKGCTHPVDEPCFGKGKGKGSMRHKLTVNGEVVAEGAEFREIRAGVADLVTVRLGAAPERLALDAQTVNMAFNSGAVEQALAERGEWFTMLDPYGEEPLRIKVTRED